MGWVTKKAFQTLKNQLCVAPVLAYPVPAEKFILDSDASDYGTTGVFSQVVNGKERVL